MIVRTTARPELPKMLTFIDNVSPELKVYARLPL